MSNSQIQRAVLKFKTHPYFVRVCQRFITTYTLFNLFLSVPDENVMLVFQFYYGLPVDFVYWNYTRGQTKLLWISAIFCQLLFTAECKPKCMQIILFLGNNTGVGCYFLLQGIFLMQGSNPHLLLDRWILYHWATREAQKIYNRDLFNFENFVGYG